MSDVRKGTVRVRILIAVDATGNWSSAGYRGAEDPKDWICTDDLDGTLAFRWVEADVPVPVEVTVEGSASDAG